MSMISSLIDELNKSADEWNKSNMFELARMCREAADTIWQLRDDLQRANDALRDAEHDVSCAWDRVRKAEAENANLRSELESVGTAAYLYGRSDLKAENAKLRELVDAWMGCGTRYHTMQGGCPMFDADAEDFCKASSIARELGIEAEECTTR